MNIPTEAGPLRPTHLNGEPVPPLRSPEPESRPPQMEYHLHVYPKWAEITAIFLAAIYRIGVAAGGFALAYVLASVLPIFAAVLLLDHSPKTKN